MSSGAPRIIHVLAWCTMQVPQVPVQEPVVPSAFHLPHLQERRKSRDVLVPLWLLSMHQGSALGVRCPAGSCCPPAVGRADLSHVW